MLKHFDEWLDWGITQGWVTDVTCLVHGGAPVDPEEDKQFQDGEDPCVHIVRVSEDVL